MQIGARLHNEFEACGVPVARIDCGNAILGIRFELIDHLIADIGEA